MVFMEKKADFINIRVFHKGESETFPVLHSIIFLHHNEVGWIVIANIYYAQKCLNGLTEVISETKRRNCSFMATINREKEGCLKI